MPVTRIQLAKTKRNFTYHKIIDKSDFNGKLTETVL